MDKTQQRINDGGPTYPHEADYIRGDKPGDPYQFKVDFHPGMSLRDHFAGQALAGLCPEDGWTLCHADSIGEIRRIAANAYGLADAMLAEREKGGDRG